MGANLSKGILMFAPGIPVAPRREGRLANWLKSQTTEDLISGARALKATADLRLDMVAELLLRGVQNDLTADAVA